MSDVEELLRAQLDRSARQVTPIEANPTQAILRRARRTQRRRAVGAVGAAALVAVVAVVTGAAVRSQAGHAPGPVGPRPSSTTSGPAPAPAALPWVAWIQAGPSQLGGPEEDLHLGTPTGDHVVFTTHGSAIEVGGFLDGGRTLVFAQGNGEPAPFALTLDADGAPVGRPRELLGNALVADGIRPVLDGTGIALRVLPTASERVGRLVRLGDHEALVSDVPVPDQSDLLLATERGALMAFRETGSATTVVRMVGWDGTTGPPLGTVSRPCPGSQDSGAPEWSTAAYDPGNDRYAFSLAPCVGGAAGADASIVEATYGSGATQPDVTSVSTKDYGGVSSLWYGADGRLHWQPVGDVGQPLGVGFVHSGPGAPVEHGGDDTNGVARVALGPSTSPWRVTMTFDASTSGPNTAGFTLTGEDAGGPRVLGVTDDPDRVVVG